MAMFCRLPGNSRGTRTGPRRGPPVGSQAGLTFSITGPVLFAFSHLKVSEQVAVEVLVPAEVVVADVPARAVGADRLRGGGSPGDEPAQRGKKQEARFS